MLPLQAKVGLGAMAIKSTPHSPKLQHYWRLTIRLFHVISRTLIMGESYPSAEMQLVYPAAPAEWFEWTWKLWQWRGTPHSAELEPHHQMQLSVIPKTQLFRDYNSLQGIVNVFSALPIGIVRRFKKYNQAFESVNL